MRARVISVVAGLASVLAASTAWAADPIMPLSEVQPGMKCTGYSVFHAQAIEPFDVEIVDIIGAAAGGQRAPKLLVRVSGERIEPTGIGPGFSGSPIYCPRADGTLANAGAISYGIGDYGGRTVLATPIEQILATPVDAPKAKGGGRISPRDASILRRAKPLTNPLSIGGLSPVAMSKLAKAGAKRGVAVFAAPAVPADSSPLAPFQPGSAVSVGLSSGDVSVAGIGTVSYVDGDNVWAYGHPFDGVGARQLILQDAYVAGIINNPIGAEGIETYKLSGPVHDVGTLTDDGFNAVVGRTGALPPTTKVLVSSTDADTGKSDELQANVADENDIGNPSGSTALSYIGPLAIFQGAGDILDAAPQQVAGRMCMQVVLRGRVKPLRFCNRYVNDGVGSAYGPGVNPVALSAGFDAQSALGVFDYFKGKPIHIVEASARIIQTRAQRQAYLRSVRLPKRLRRGTTVPVTMVVKVVRGERRTIRFRWRVPPTLKLGKRKLDVRGVDPDNGGGGFFDEIIIELTGGDDDSEPYYDSEGPRTVKKLVKAFKSMHRWDGIRLATKKGQRFYRDPTYRIGGRAVRKVEIVRADGSRKRKHKHKRDKNG